MARSAPASVQGKVILRQQVGSSHGRSHLSNQCGYCTPGQIMSAIGMLREAEQRVPSHATPRGTKTPGIDELSAKEIRERMSGSGGRKWLSSKGWLKAS